MDASKPRIEQHTMNLIVALTEPHLSSSRWLINNVFPLPLKLQDQQAKTKIETINNQPGMEREAMNPVRANNIKICNFINYVILILKKFKKKKLIKIDSYNLFRKSIERKLHLQDNEI